MIGHGEDENRNIFNILETENIEKDIRKILQKCNKIVPFRRIAVYHPRSMHFATMLHPRIHPALIEDRMPRSTESIDHRL